MSRTIFDLQALIANPALSADDRRRFLAVLNLGLVEALERELIQVADAERMLYNGRNGYLAAEQCPGDDLVEDVLARGVQLADLADVLTKGEAALELRRELNALRHDSIALLREIQLHQGRAGAEAADGRSPVAG